MKNTILAVVVLVVGAAAFWGGGLYKEQAIRANPRALFSQGGFGGQGGQGAQGGAPGGSGAPGGMLGGVRRDGQGGAPGGQGAPGGVRGGAPVLSGTLDEVTDDELTITTAFGSVTVKIDDKTKVKRAEKSDANSLKLTEKVLIDGERDDDGNVTAKTVIQ